MSYHLEVLVQLPDGGISYCSVMVNNGKEKSTVRHFDTRKSAYDWAEHCLPDKIHIVDNIVTDEVETKKFPAIAPATAPADFAAASEDCSCT